MTTEFHQRLKADGARMKTVEQEFGDAGVSYLVTQMPDTVGRLRCKMGRLKVSGTGESVNPIFYCVTEGEGTPSGEILFESDACSAAAGYPNILGIADPSTLVRHGWEPSTASMMIDTYLLDGTRCPYDVRGILARADATARDNGIDARFALEYEFGIFHADQDLAQKGAYSQLTPWGDSLHNYSILRSADYQDFVREYMTRMDSLGIPVPSFTTEYGFGMYEFALAPASALKAADDAVRAKLCLQELCTERGLVATFMARFQPVGKESACGAHHHVSLWQDGKPVTTNADASLSDLGKSFLAGMLHYLPETHLFFRPTLNSYRRFDKNAWCPEDASWGYENRMAAIRAITGPTASAGRFEHRVAGADVNPYLTIAAMLAAGTAGVRQNLRPAPAMEENPEIDAPALSNTLAGAIAAFEASEFCKTTFGSAFHTHYRDSRKAEQDAFDAWLGAHITEFEWQRHFL